MNNNTSSRNTSKLDFLKWILVIALVSAVVVLNQYLTEHSVLVKIAAAATVSLMALAIFFSTSKGKFVWQFGKEAIVELRKVVWPTKNETMQSTGIIFVMVLVVSLLLWVMDNISLKFVDWLTGLGGA